MGWECVGWECGLGVWVGSVGLLLGRFSIGLSLCVWVESVGSVCAGWECWECVCGLGVLGVCVWVGSVGSVCVGWECWECVCGLGVLGVCVWVGSVGLSSLCLIAICNEQQARFYLKATNWDLNVTVVNYYDGTNAIEEPKQVTILKVQMYNLLQLIRSGDIFCEINDVR
ncbi:unnamed protein product [Rhizophagus irregularis]|uniref:UBA-like domain-containing protein n=1 Tax=Rhizophagus irregularis TaxID=588596 RepID=A0A915YV12_9GLOM|nr:unnamed protein product [Rhizophagus irregularis]